MLAWGVDAFFVTANATVCGPRNLSSCLYPKYNYFMANNLLSECQCPDQCSKLTYSYVISQAAISKQTVRWIMANWPSLSKEKILENYLSLEVWSLQSSMRIDYILYSSCNVLICARAANRHENTIDSVQIFNKTAGLSPRWWVQPTPVEGAASVFK